MTKYILHGGRIRTYTDSCKAFFDEMVNGLEQPRLLLCFFSRGRERWESDYGYYRDFLSDLLPHTQLEMAMPDKYREQVAKTDALLVLGGDDELLEYRARKTDGFVDSLRHLKVVAGSSAGADLLARSYWTCDWREIRDGLGIVPANIIPHFDSDYGRDDIRGPIDWGKAYEELAVHTAQELPIYKLHEGEFITFEQ